MQLLVRLCVAGCILLLLGPGICWSFVDPRLPSLIQGIVVPAALLAVFFSLCGKRLWLGFLLLSPLVALAPIEAVFVVIYKHPLDHEILATIFESNVREARDYLGVVLWTLVGSTIAAFIVAIATSILARRVSLKWRGKLREASLACVILLPCALFISLFVSSTGPLQARVYSTGIRILGYSTLLEGGYPFGLPVHAIEYYVAWLDMRREAAKLTEFRFNARLVSALNSRQIYVFIIGESSNRDHWSLFGYPRLTTPNLQTLTNLVPLTNMVSPWNASRKAIPVLLTRKPGTDANDYFKEASIVRAFSEAGFATYWLSNQLAVGQHDSPISAYAYEASTVRFFNFANWDYRGTFDEVLVNALRTTISESSGNVFIVLHTMGSHARYEHRYPKEFERFRPSAVFGESNPTETETFNAYDNSILYTDYVISSVVNVLKSTNALTAMLYASDHGESVADGKCKLFGHGNGSQANYFIPALLWYSDEYLENFPTRIDALLENHTKPISSENVFESLIDLGGLSFSGHDKTRSFMDAEFFPHKRLLGSSGLVDIDQSYFTDVCKLVIPSQSATEKSTR